MVQRKNGDPGPHSFNAFYEELAFDGSIYHQQNSKSRTSSPPSAGDVAAVVVPLVGLSCISVRAAATVRDVDMVVHWSFLRDVRAPSGVWEGAVFHRKGGAIHRG